MSLLSLGEELATDAFRFLDDFDDVMSFGDEDDDSGEDVTAPQREHWNY